MKLNTRLKPNSVTVKQQKSFSVSLVKSFYLFDENWFLILGRGEEVLSLEMCLAVC